MKLLSLLGALIAALVLCALAQSAEAAAACGYPDNNRGFNGSVALQISTLSVPRDMPVGTVIYQQNFNQDGVGADFQCGGTGGTAAVNTILSLSSGQTSTGFSAGLYANSVFATSVPGIGIAWFNGTTVIPSAGVVRDSIVDGCSSTAKGAPSGGCRIVALKLQPAAGIALIKIGPVATGTISASSLGKMTLAANVAGSATFVVNSLSLTGSINIVALTCQTPDVNVSMGSYGTASLKGIGSATAEVNFVIPLTGCPGFPGYYGNANSVPTTSQTGVVTAGTLVPNTISLRVDPAATPIDATNGVLSLTAGADTATGVGLQLLHHSGAPWVLSQNQLLNVGLSAGTTTLNIPLSARYLQTASTVTPGKANAVATYTIIYQ
jgi:major type 1 subunit fimbrin (pilin)